MRLATVAGPKQARSERTLRRLLEAAERLILAKGLSDTSIPEIVREAGSSVGGFYARFRDKNELLRALEERFYQEMSVRLEDLFDVARWDGVPTAVVVEGLVAELVQVTREKEQLVAAFMYRSAQDPAFVEDAVRFRDQITQRVARLLLDRREEMRHPEPEVAVELGVQAAFALMHERVLFGRTSFRDRDLTDEEWRREITRLVLGYVGIHVDGPR